MIVCQIQLINSLYLEKCVIKLILFHLYLFKSVFILIISFYIYLSNLLFYLLDVQWNIYYFFKYNNILSYFYVFFLVSINHLIPNILILPRIYIIFITFICNIFIHFYNDTYLYVVYTLVYFIIHSSYTK